MFFDMLRYVYSESVLSTLYIEIAHNRKINQGRSQNLKQVLQNFMKTFNVEDVALTSHLMMSYRKINVASETMINDIVTSPSNRHWKKLEFGYNIFFSLSKVSQLNI